MANWGAGAAKAWNRSTLPEHENDAVDGSHLVVQMASLVEDGRVLDWYAKRAATDALDAVRHENAADMICVLAIDLTRHFILCKIDLLGGEDVVVVAAVGAAISATPGAKAARRTKPTTRPAAGKLLTNRVRLLFMSVGMLVHVLKNGIARTKTETAAEIHATVLAASGSNSPTQLVSGTTLLSLGQMLDLPILAAAEAGV